MKRQGSISYGGLFHGNCAKGQKIVVVVLYRLTKLRQRPQIGNRRAAHGALPGEGCSRARSGNAASGGGGSHPADGGGGAAVAGRPKRLVPGTGDGSGAGAGCASGIASAQVSVDGGGWQNGQTTVPEGVHQVQVQVEDGAGWTATAQAVVKVDTAPPEITLASGGSGAASNCRARLAGALTDADSGVVRAALSLDHGAWEPLPFDAQGRWQRETDLLADGEHTLAVRAWDAAGRMGEARWQVTIANAGPSLRVTPGGNRWMFWERLRISAGWACVPVKRLEVRIWEPGTPHERKWVWEDGWEGGEVAVKWNTRWYSASGPYAHAGEYPIAITVWDAWGRQSGVRGVMVVPAQATATPTVQPTSTPTPTATAAAGMGAVVVHQPTATATTVSRGGSQPTPTPPGSGWNGGGVVVVRQPTATPTVQPTMAAGSGGSPPQAPVAGGGSGAVVVNGATTTRVVSGAPQRRPLSHLPLWGGAAAAFLALWAAYARRKRLQRAWEAARARAARAAWDAADRARRLALIQAVARDRAKHPPKAPNPHPHPPEPPPVPDLQEVIAQRKAELAAHHPAGEGVTAAARREALHDEKILQRQEGLTGGPTGASPAAEAAATDANDPNAARLHQGRGLWGDERGPANPAPSPDLAAWKQQDYAHIVHAHEVAQQLPPPDVPWYERWKLPGWVKKALGVRKALGNTSIRANKWGEDRYALSYRNPNWGQRAVRWVQGKWERWFGKEPPRWLEKVDEALGSGAEDAGEVMEGLGLKPGGGYHAETIESAVSESVWEGALKPKVLGLAALVGVAQNVITYGFGSKKDLGLRSPEFFTSTVVDTGVNVLLGLATAGIVAVVVIPALPVEATVAAVGAAGLVTGFAVSWAFNHFNSWAGSVITKQEGTTMTDWLKSSWARHIRRSAEQPAPEIEDMDWPDTPNGLAP